MTEDTTALIEPAIVHADAPDLPVSDASVDLVVTSPSCYGLRSYRDGHRA